MIACFLSNISAKYYKNPSMLSRVIAKNVADVFLRHSVYCVTRYLCTSWRDLGEIWHKYLSCEYESLERLSRSDLLCVNWEVKLYLLT